MSGAGPDTRPTARLRASDPRGGVRRPPASRRGHHLRDPATGGAEETGTPHPCDERAGGPPTREDGLLPEEVVESLAQALRVLADPTRIRLIEALATDGHATVSALSAGLPLTRQGVSRQLGVLHRAGLVRRRREGMSVRYELADWTGWWVVEQLSGAISEPGT